jgi:hypothetical protein
MLCRSLPGALSSCRNRKAALSVRASADNRFCEVDEQMGRGAADGIIDRFRNSPNLKATDASPAGWAINRQDLAWQLFERVQNGRLPDQQQASLCGPAALMYCLIRDRPDIYAQYVIDLWTTGKAKLGKWDVQPSSRLISNTATAASSKFGVDAIDWITMASARQQIDSDYDSPSDEISAMTTSRQMQKLFTALGCDTVADTARRLISRFDEENLYDLTKYSSSNFWIVFYIDADVLNGKVNLVSVFPTHWAVLRPFSLVTVDGKIINSISRDDIEDYDNKPIVMDLVTWGSDSFHFPPGTTLGDFVHACHGGFLFTPIP